MDERVEFNRELAEKYQTGEITDSAKQARIREAEYSNRNGEETGKRFKTSVTIYSGNNSAFNVVTHGEAKISIYEGKGPREGQLKIDIIEDGIKVKEFTWRAGHWLNYSVIRMEVPSGSQTSF